MLTLMRHQERAVVISRERKRYALFWKPGCGKTIAAFAMIADAIARGFHGRVLVLAPKAILKTAWLSDARHFPQLRCSVVWADKPALRKEQIASPGDVFITNYETFKKHAKDFFEAGINWLIVDESQGLKNHTAKLTQEVAYFSTRMQRVNLLSGTPAPNGEHEYIPQLYCLDPAIFGTNNFWKIVYRYFFPIKKFMKGKNFTVGYTLIPHKREAFLTLLKNNAWSLDREECIELHGETFVPRRIELSQAESRAYMQCAYELRVAIGDGTAFDVRAQAKLMKLRQLSSGMIYTDDGLRIFGTSKLDALCQLIDELEGEQVVIWAEFTGEIDAIMARMSENGCAVERVDSHQVDPAAAINCFQAGQTRYLVCQPQCCGHGVTLTAAAHDIIYSLSWSWERHEQMLARIYRNGQIRKVVHYYLIAEGTADERMLDCLLQKQNMSNTVMAWLHEHTGQPAPRSSSPPRPTPPICLPAIAAP